MHAFTTKDLGIVAWAVAKLEACVRPSDCWHSLLYKLRLCNASEDASDPFVALLATETAARCEQLSGKEAVNLAWALAKMKVLRCKSKISSFETSFLLLLGRVGTPAGEVNEPLLMESLVHRTAAKLPCLNRTQSRMQRLLSSGDCQLAGCRSRQGLFVPCQELVRQAGRRKCGLGFCQGWGVWLHKPAMHSIMH